MTKKLDKFAKEQRKMRRKALITIKKLLTNKKKNISVTCETGLDRTFLRMGDEYPTILDTGQRKIILEWHEKPKRGKI